MISDASTFFEQEQKEKSNDICADCGELHPQWASVTLGVYLCIVCSGVHRSFGVHISFVRSLTMDKWKDKQLEHMRRGGNAKLNTFLARHGVSSAASIAEKYYSKAAEAYRQQLRAAVEGTAKPPDPTSGTGHELYAPALPQTKPVHASKDSRWSFFAKEHEKPKSLVEELARVGKKISPVVLLIGQPRRGKRTFVNWMHSDLIAHGDGEPVLLVSKDPPSELAALPTKSCASDVSFLIVDDPLKGKAYFAHCHLCICFLKADDDIPDLPADMPTHYFVPKADLQKESQCVTEVGKVSTRLNERFGEFKPVEFVGLYPQKDLGGFGYLLEDLPMPELTWKGQKVSERGVPRSHSLSSVKNAVELAMGIAVEREYLKQVESSTVRRSMAPYCAGIPLALAVLYDLLIAAILLVIWLVVVARYERTFGDYRRDQERLHSAFRNFMRAETKK